MAEEVPTQFSHTSAPHPDSALPDTEALKKRSATLSFSYFPYLVPLFSTSSFLSQYTFVLHILPQNPLFDQLSLSFFPPLLIQRVTVPSVTSNTLRDAKESCFA